LRTTDEEIEAEGVRRAKLQAERADVVVAVVDGEDFEGEIGEEIQELMVPERTLVVVSKADLCERDFGHEIETRNQKPDTRGKYPLVAVNLRERAALGRVTGALGKLISAVARGASEAALLTRERHKMAVEEAVAALGNALITCAKADGKGTVAELVAQDLREAAAAIGSVTGRTSSEDVLDVVFSTFCIGK
jgi:tRNA modification GTPase